jgi:hypothetical protein
MATSGPGAALEMKCHHMLENQDKDLLMVQGLEVILCVVEQWAPDCPEWKAAALMVGKHHYQCCLDDLEGLIISRMFELTNMNMSQTGMCSYPVYMSTNTHLGYKLHKHIATAL